MSTVSIFRVIDAWSVGAAHYIRGEADDGTSQAFLVHRDDVETIWKPVRSHING